MCGFCVLRTLARQRPDPVIEIDLVPAHPGDLVAALPGQGEGLDDRSVGPAQLTGRSDDPCEFPVRKNPVSGAFNCRRADARAGRLADASVVPSIARAPHGN